MILNELKVIELFCELDDFVQAFDKKLAEHLIESNHRGSKNKPGISISEMMCIEILYHHSGYKCFQYYYKQEAEHGYLKSYFTAAPSYTEDNKGFILWKGQLEERLV